MVDDPEISALRRTSPCACFAPDRTAGDTGLCSEFKLVLHQPAHGVVVHEQKNEIGRRCADLWS
jgi:hypothetical protein